MTGREMQAMLAATSQLLQESHHRVGEDGVAVAGSWSAIDDPAHPEVQASTIEVASGKTAAILGPQNDQYDKDSGIAKPRVDVATTAIGDQYAPRGGERTVMLPTESTPIALFVHGADDTNAGIPAGERWICHRNAAGVVDSYIKLTNDGDAGDGKGGLKFGFGSLSEIETIGGHSIVLDDGAKKITITSAGGLTAILDDNSGTIQFAGSGNASGDALVRQSDLVTLLSAIQAKLTTWASASLQGGSGAGPPSLTSITPTASAKTFTA